MTPYEIDILLHYHTRPGDHETAVMQNQHAENVYAGFMDAGLLAKSVETGKLYRITRKGSFYVTEGLGCVPLPDCKFVIDWERAK